MFFDEFMNKKQYRYDDKNKFFYMPNTDVKINISAEDALSIIGAFTVFLWDAKKIQYRVLWERIPEEMVSTFLKEYSEGHLEEAIAWICDNNIECKNKDKFKYLARYALK